MVAGADDRPASVLRSARALERYGPDFRYAHYIVVKRLPTLGGLGAGVGALVALAQLPPTRDLLLKFWSPGDGPSDAESGRGRGSTSGSWARAAAGA